MQSSDGVAKLWLPEAVADVLVSFDTVVAQGRLAVVSNAVADLTGRSLQKVGDVLFAHRAVLLLEEVKAQ